MAVLQVRDIVKDYPTRSGTLRVLDGCTFALHDGQSLAVIGPSGSGKSTLLSILGTLETPTSGTVSLDGIEPAHLGPTETARFRREHVGFVFQDHHLLPQLGALENVLVPFLADGKASPEQKERAAALLERVGLGKRLDHRPAELSGGERQRVALARAVVREPSLVLADEPTGNLDRRHAGDVADLLYEISAAAMLVLVTHDTALADRADTVFELLDGRLQNRTGGITPLS